MSARNDLSLAVVHHFHIKHRNYTVWILNNPHRKWARGYTRKAATIKKKKKGNTRKEHLQIYYTYIYYYFLLPRKQLASYRFLF